MQLSYARAVQLAGAPSRPASHAPPAEDVSRAEASAEDGPSQVADPDVAPEAGPAGGEPAAKKSAVRKPTAKRPAADKAASDGTAAKQRASKTAPKGAAPKKKKRTDAAPDEG